MTSDVFDVRSAIDAICLLGMRIATSVIRVLMGTFLWMLLWMTSLFITRGTTFLARRPDETIPSIQGPCEDDSSTVDVLVFVR